MADAPKLQGTERLGESYYKINMGIDNANEALKKSLQSETISNNAINTANSAVNTANTAETKADSVQEQFDQIVIEGSIDPETKQARVDSEGKPFPTLKARIDDGQKKLDTFKKKGRGNKYCH
ncbi:hypothetical protein [Bacillus cereus]|uniref:hypothetical protein n=1 Tax=Bacillus cereus TaxID=1396 RepID=UPI000BFE92FC|nr:hypothetical protein [Bacillus cereus]PGQ73788.1 hypothetical protein COA27_09920 [Bacillus cereus]